MARERRGFRSAMPDDPSAVRFRVSLCFFANETDERPPDEVDPNSFRLTGFVEDHDPELARLIRASEDDRRAARWRVSYGEPDDELDAALEAWERREGRDLPVSGFVVLTGVVAGDAGADGSALEPGFANVPALGALLRYVRESYGPPTEVGEP